MYFATLKSCALNKIVSHLCDVTTRKEKKVSQNLIYLLKQDGIYEMFAKLIFQKMVEMYPLLVSNRLVEICCHGYLKELDLKKCRNVSSDGLTNAVKSCPNLERLNLSECDQLVCKDLIYMLQENAKKLRCLKLDFCKTLTDELLQLVVQVLPHLTEFSCEGCTKLINLQLQNIPLHKISAPLNYLTTVNLSGCQELNCTFIRHLTSVTRSNLKSLNVSSTSIDCIALVYLSGYSLSSAVTIATKLKTKMVAHQQQSDNDVFREADDNTESDPIDPESGYIETVSDYVKKMCAYCSHELAARQLSGNTDSLNIYSITESYEDYDIVDSQVVNIIESDFDNSSGHVARGSQGTLVDEAEQKEKDLEWAVLSIEDASLENKCTCSGHDSDEACSSSNSQEGDKLDGKCSFDDDERLEETGLYGSSDCKPIFTPNLTTLDISSTSFYDTGFYELDVVKECFLLFLTSNKNLKTLHMSWASEEISDDIVRLIADKQPKLESLSLAGCVQISNCGLKNAVEKFENLKALDISGVSFVTDESLCPLVTKHTELQQLYFAESMLTDRVLSQISSTLCNSMRHLDLSWCENISDDGVVKLLSSCPELVYLDLRQCEISAHALRAITQYGRNLTVIGLNGIRGLNDTICVEMVKNLPRLHRVDFSWNTSITDDSICALCQSCPLLREVVISGLKRITSKPFLPIISGLAEWRHCREKILSRLYSQMQPNTYINVKERDVANLEAQEADFYLPFRSVNYVPVLQKLTLGYCDKVNDNHLAEITAVCRGTLMIEDYYGALIKAKWSDVK